MSTFGAIEYCLSQCDLVLTCASPCHHHFVLNVHMCAFILLPITFLLFLVALFTLPLKPHPIHLQDSSRKRWPVLATFRESFHVVFVWFSSYRHHKCINVYLHVWQYALIGPYWPLWDIISYFQSVLIWFHCNNIVTSYSSLVGPYWILFNISTQHWPCSTAIILSPCVLPLFTLIELYLISPVSTDLVLR